MSHPPASPGLGIEAQGENSERDTVFNLKNYEVQLDDQSLAKSSSQLFEREFVLFTSGFSRLGIAEHWFQFFHEIVDVLKFTVDRGKADEGNLIDGSEEIEHTFADVGRRDFTLEILIDIGFDPVHDFFDPGIADRALVAGFFQARTDFVPIKGDPAAILLDHFQRRFFNFFVRSETTSAVETFTTTADSIFLTHT